KNLQTATQPLDRCYIQNALACLGDPAGIAALVENLKHPDPAVRIYAGEFAGEARAAAAEPTLLDLLADPTLDVRVRAAQALLTLSRPVETEEGPMEQTVFPASDK